LGRAAEQKPPEKIDSQHKTSAWGKESLAKRTFFSSLLGHASTKITTDVYQHIDFEDLKAPLAGMSSMLLASVSKSSDSAGSKGKFLN
jgi:hypothetical protein